jgi:hypothetical protein
MKTSLSKPATALAVAAAFTLAATTDLLAATSDDAVTAWATANTKGCTQIDFLGMANDPDVIETTFYVKCHGQITLPLRVVCTPLVLGGWMCTSGVLEGWSVVK